MKHELDCTWFEAVTVAEELDALIAYLDTRRGWFMPNARTVLTARSRLYRARAETLHGKKPQ
jgi:hypothetical protein